MKNMDKNTESKILEAAKKVFVEKGFDGARMQEIADTAGINKALLHYYFRSKDKLFLTIFEEAFKSFSPKLGLILISDLPFLEKIRLFIESYIDLLLENPFLPLFVLNEISRNPEVIQNVVVSSIEQIFKNMDAVISKEVELGLIRKVDTYQLILNIVSMCIFPFAGKPLLKLLFNKTDEEYRNLIFERKKIIYDVISSWLRP
jgi:AcrR family transcriptional regulator